MRWLASTSAIAGCARVSSITAGAAATGAAALAAAPPAGLNLSATSRTRASASSVQVLASRVAIDARQQAPGAELGEPFVDDAAGLAELGVTGIAERQHRVLQLGQLRRALGTEEFVQAARLVRRIAVTVRADDHVQ